MTDDDELRLTLLRLTEPPLDSPERIWRRWLRETRLLRMPDSAIDALSADGGQESPGLLDALWQRNEAGDR